MIKICSKYRNEKTKQDWKVFAFLFAIVCVVLLSDIKSSYALCSNCAGTVNGQASQIWEEAEETFDDELDESFRDLETFIVQNMWAESILPVMLLAAENFTAVALQQSMIIGTFIDAENQLAAQRVLQEIQAKAHKDYHPSVGMCEFGSVMKSLVYTELRGELSSVAFSQRSMDRQLGQSDTTGMYGADLDKEYRIEQFKNIFCNEIDRETALSAVCPNANWELSTFDEAARDRMNKDIDYFSLVDAPLNMKLDFTNTEILDAAATPPIHNEDEEHLMAMGINLFAHELFPRIPARLLENKPDEPLSLMQQAYMDMRSIIAKRSVAENSLYAISALKTEGYKEPIAGVAGSEVLSSRPYMEHILRDLGVVDKNGSGSSDDEILKMLGEKPSYHAQMEIITKKMYQNPEFYTNLYDKPANVERKAAALQAIKLMQKFDMLKSFLRGEASTSILLELAVVELQNEIEDQIKTMGVAKKGE